MVRADENNWLLLNSPDHISDFIRKNGYWGLNEATIAKVFLAKRSHTNVLDIGSNIGGFTLPIAKFVSSNHGKVFAFEPQRIVFQQLCANIFLNRLDNVYSYNIALSDNVCEIEIPELAFWKSQNIGAFSLDESIRANLVGEAKIGKTLKNEESDKKYSVQQRTLDSLDFSFEISLMKVDVEGLELEFFKGGLNTIKRNDFPPIIFELWENKSWYKEKAENTKKILTEWGYKFYAFGREILAQNPKHSIQCEITKENNKINLAIKR